MAGPVPTDLRFARTLDAGPAQCSGGLSRSRSAEETAQARPEMQAQYSFHLDRLHHRLADEQVAATSFVPPHARVPGLKPQDILASDLVARSKLAVPVQVLTR